MSFNIIHGEVKIIDGALILLVTDQTVLTQVNKPSRCIKPLDHTGIEKKIPATHDLSDGLYYMPWVYTTRGEFVKHWLEKVVIIGINYIYPGAVLQLLGELYAGLGTGETHSKYNDLLLHALHVNFSFSPLRCVESKPLKASPLKL